MKVLTALVLAGFSCLSLANEQSANTEHAMHGKVSQYTYGMDLDISEVIHTTDLQDACGVVPAQMTYEDQQGQRHTIEYQVMGNGCSNG